MIPAITISLKESPFDSKTFFKILTSSINDSRGFFRVMARPIFQQEISLNFLHQQPPDSGKKWKELAGLTQRIRINRGYNPTKPILIQSGAMLSEVTRNKPKLENITQHTYRIGIRGKHGQAHDLHFGGTVLTPSGYKADLPARPFFFLSNSGVRFLISKYLVYITAGLVKGVSKATLAEYKGGARISALPGM